MEKMIYDERALRAFKANFEKVRDRLMHLHECDLGLVDFRSELVVQLYKACDYRCLYRFMPVHEMTMMEMCRLISKCNDYIVRDFIRHFLADMHFDCLRACCDGLYPDDDDDVDIIDYDKLDGTERQIWAEISDLKNPQLWFDELEEDKREICGWNEFVRAEDAFVEGKVSQIREWYCMGWKTVLEWVRDKYGLDVLKHFIWDTYVKKDVSVVVGKELEEHIESYETIYNSKEQIRKWFDDPKVQKDFLLSGKDIICWLKEKNTEWRKVKRLSGWFHL